MRNCRNGHPIEYFPKRLTLFGRFLWRIYCFEIFPSADCTDHIYNWWNPISWICFIITALFIFISGGVEALSEEWAKNKLGFCYSEYWKKNKNRIELIPRNL